MPKKKKTQRGRPLKAADAKKNVYLAIRMDEPEKATYQIAADVAGVPLSVWVRERLRSIARQALIEAGKEDPFLSK